MQKQSFFLSFFLVCLGLNLFAQPSTTVNPSAINNVLTQAAFVHSSNSTNTPGGSNYTHINATVCNNNPNAIVHVMTRTYEVCPKHIGVWYDEGQKKWAIFNQDKSPMSANKDFNVVIDGGFVHTATASNTTGNWTVIDNPATNNNPNAIIIVTQRFNSTASVYNNRAVGAWYNTKLNKWTIFNEDQSPLAANLQFNVKVTAAATPFSTNPTAFANNITNIQQRLLPTGIGGQNAIIVATHVYGGANPKYLTYTPHISYFGSPNAFWQILYGNCGGDVPSYLEVGHIFHLLSYK
ncbi:MAG: hypothetical protein ACKVTZ_19225 [Bacteroidia bacterium]